MSLSVDAVSATARSLSGDLLCGPVSFERGSVVAELRKLVREQHRSDAPVQVQLLLGLAVLQDSDAVQGDAIECTAIVKLKKHELEDDLRMKYIADLGFGEDVRTRLALFPVIAREDPKLLSEAIRRCSDVLHDVDGALLSNRDFFLAAPPWMLQHASKEIQSDHEVVRRAVQADGHLLEWASSAMQSDRGIVLEAVSCSGRAIRFAEMRLQQDYEIARAAVRQNAEAFIWAHRRVPYDKETVFALLQHLEADLRRRSIERNRRSQQKCRQRVREMWDYTNTSFTRDPAFLNEVARVFPAVAQLERRTRLYGLVSHVGKIERQRLAPERQERRR